MSILVHIFGWNYRVRKLRKRWDRLREKSLKKKGVIRQAALKRLDSIENSVVTLEEQRLGRIDRVRFVRDIEVSLAEVKEILKSNPEEFVRETEKYQKIRRPNI